MTAPLARSWLAPALLILAGCHAHAEGKTAPPPDAARPSGRAAKLFDDLAMLTVGTTLPPPPRGTTLEAQVAVLLADPRFARDVAPEILFNKKAVDLAEEDPWESLQVTTGSPPVYFLRRPCEAGAAERVHPWWALDTEVLVCPDAHQPTHLREPATGWYCGGANLESARSPFCGCGPNLMSCTRDEAQSDELRRALRDELTQTVAYVVERDLPLERLFTMNETVRTGYSELHYQRWQVIQGKRAAVGDYRAWAGAGKLAPREETTPGQHAGLLTAPHLLLYGDTPRARMRNDFSDMWCVTPASVDVTTAQVLGLGVTDLRDGDGWKKLAVMPVCTECHARLDHGMQFFAGYPSTYVGVLYDGRAVPRDARGSLYGHGSGDLRGEAPLSPRGFATLAVQQREFSRCMVRDVTDHVFNGDATGEDQRALLEVFARQGTLRAVMREALLRFARRAGEAAPPAAPGATLQVQVEAHCQACHGEGPAAFPGDGAYSPALLGRMLRQVAFGEMPRAPAELTPGERREMVSALIAARWADEASRGEARRYFAGGMRGLPAHRGSALLGLVESRASALDEEASSWTFSDADRHDAVEMRPSFVITYALAALRSCRAAGHRGHALEACVERVLDVEAAAKGR